MWFLVLLQLGKQQLEPFFEPQGGTSIHISQMAEEFPEATEPMCPSLVKLHP